MTSEDESHEDDSGEIRPKYKDSGFLRYFFLFLSLCIIHILKTHSLFTKSLNVFFSPSSLHYYEDMTCTCGLHIVNVKTT